MTPLLARVTWPLFNALRRLKLTNLPRTQEQRFSTDTDERLRLDTEESWPRSKNSGFARRRQHAKYKRRRQLKRSGGRRRQAEEVKVPILGDEICCLSLVTEALKEERNELVSVFIMVLGDRFLLSIRANPGFIFERGLAWRSRI